MTLKSLTKTINSQTLIFTNQRALFWVEKRALIISDLHIGKTAYFRKNGIAVPSGILTDDLTRLGALLIHYEAAELIIVGDFLHVGRNADFQIFETWLQEFAHLKIIIIKGNHDVIKSEFMSQLPAEIHEDHLTIEPFNFIHVPDEDEDYFTISGHLHPGVTVKLERNKYVSLPCFRYTDRQLVLPAFSKFTGLDTKSCGDFNCIPFTEELIFEM